MEIDVLRVSFVSVHDGCAASKHGDASESCTSINHANDSTTADDVKVITLPRYHLCVFHVLSFWSGDQWC